MVCVTDIFCKCVLFKLLNVSFYFTVKEVFAIPLDCIFRKKLTPQEQKRIIEEKRYILSLESLIAVLYSLK